MSTNISKRPIITLMIAILFLLSAAIFANYVYGKFGSSGQLAIIIFILLICMLIIAAIGQYLDQLSERVDEILTPLTPKKIPGDRKKEAILKMGPKTFYYLDENQIKDLYSQVSREPELRQIETRESKETKKGICAKLVAPITARYEKDRAEETKKSYDVNLTLATMYNKVEQYLFDNDKVLFGLEEFDYDKKLIEELNSLISQLKTKLGEKSPLETLQKEFVSEKMNDFALKGIQKLSESSGYVAIQTEFLIVDIKEGSCILSFVHPLNEYLLKNDIEAKIQIICSKVPMSESGKSTFQKDKKIKITCVGKVVSWNDKENTLEISPIALY